MKTVLVGAVESTETALRVMCSSGFSPALVVTLAPELAGRHSDFVDLRPLAATHSIALHLTRCSNDPNTLAMIAEIAPDVILAIGWSQLCNAAFRALPALGCLGYHPSALPKLRGRAVIPWTILLGETISGASIFWLDEGADTGDIASQQQFPIDPETETARSLYDKQLETLADLLPPLLFRLASGDVPRQMQDHEKATICASRVAEDGRIDWRTPAADIHRLIRAVGQPYPGALTRDASRTELVLTSAQPADPPGRYIGLPGQVQAVTGRGFTVMCGDGQCLDITGWIGAETPPRLHSRLG